MNNHSFSFNNCFFSNINKEEENYCACNQESCAHFKCGIKTMDKSKYLHGLAKLLI